MLVHCRIPPTEDVSHFVNIGPTISIQVLILHVFFLDFRGDIQMTLRTLIKIVYVGT